MKKKNFSFSPFDNVNASDAFTNSLKMRLNFTNVNLGNPSLYTSDIFTCHTFQTGKYTYFFLFNIFIISKKATAKLSCHWR